MTMTTSSNPLEKSLPLAGGQFVTFGLGGETFALSVQNVREILDYSASTRIPNAAMYISGLLQVRGQAVPIFDLRLILGAAEVARSSKTRIMIIESEDAGGDFGFVADNVFEVQFFGNEDIEGAHDRGLRWASNHTKGIIRKPDGLIMLLDIAEIKETVSKVGGVQRV